MIVVLRLKTYKDYKYINFANVTYFERYTEDETKSMVYFVNREPLLVHVDAEIIHEELQEIIEGILLGEKEEQDEAGKKDRH